MYVPMYVPTHIIYIVVRVLLLTTERGKVLRSSICNERSQQFPPVLQATIPGYVSPVTIHNSGDQLEKYAINY